MCAKVIYQFLSYCLFLFKAKMSEGNSAVTTVTGNPYKIVDCSREKRKGITAASLEDLTNVARSRLALPTDADITIVLEQDGNLF